MRSPEEDVEAAAAELVWAMNRLTLAFDAVGDDVVASGHVGYTLRLQLERLALRVSGVHHPVREAS